jgi:predicted  nucleic acid-binding Zn-ribbon protein
MRHLERQLEEKQEELTKYNAQLPLIKTNREYKAILLEIDSVEKEISDIEEHILERMTEIDEVEARAAAEEAVVNKAKAEAEREKEQLAKKQKALEELLDGTRSRREELASSVDVALLNRYDRIRVQKGGLATARINDESCGACHMVLPPQVVNEVIGGVIRPCPSCSRLLYWMGLEQK